MLSIILGSLALGILFIAACRKGITLTQLAYTAVILVIICTGIYLFFSFPIAISIGIGVIILLYFIKRIKRASSSEKTTDTAEPPSTKYVAPHASASEKTQEEPLYSEDFILVKYLSIDRKNEQLKHFLLGNSKAQKGYMEELRKIKANYRRKRPFSPDDIVGNALILFRKTDGFGNAYVKYHMIVLLFSPQNGSNTIVDYNKDARRTYFFITSECRNEYTTEYDGYEYGVNPHPGYDEEGGRPKYVITSTTSYEVETSVKQFTDFGELLAALLIKGVIDSGEIYEIKTFDEQEEQAKKAVYSL